MIARAGFEPRRVCGTFLRAAHYERGLHRAFIAKRRHYEEEEVYDEHQCPK